MPAKAAPKKEATAKKQAPKAAEKKTVKKVVEKKPVKAVPKVEKVDPVLAQQQIVDLTEIIFYPLITEKAVSMIEKENKLAFIVADSATKGKIKKAVQDVYQVKVRDVNLIRDRKGRKKAFVRLDKANKASDVAIKLGVI